MKTILILLACLMVSCAPLKTIHKKQYNDVVTIDSTLVSLVIKELLNQKTEIKTTVIEFETPDSVAVVPMVIDGNKPITVRQPIKRITTTELVQTTEKTTEIDSTAQKRVHIIDKTETEVESEEKPSSVVQGMKQIAKIIGLIALIALIIYIAIKRR